MESQATPTFLIGHMRVLTMPEMTFFHVINRPTALANLDRDLDTMMSSLDAARAQAGMAQAGPIVIRYYGVQTDTHGGDAELFLMEVGVPVQPGTPPAGEARVKVLPTYRCASLLLWGSLAHVEAAYATLMQSIKEAGLERTGEGREWYYWFEGDDSANNLLGICMGVR